MIQFESIQVVLVHTTGGDISPAGWNTRCVSYNVYVVCSDAQIYCDQKDGNHINVVCGDGDISDSNTSCMHVFLFRTYSSEKHVLVKNIFWKKVCLTYYVNHKHWYVIYIFVGCSRGPQCSNMFNVHMVHCARRRVFDCVGFTKVFLVNTYTAKHYSPICWKKVCWTYAMVHCGRCAWSIHLVFLPMGRKYYMCGYIVQW